MKKLIAVFCLGLITLSANADERYAHEYSSDNDDERHDRQRDNGYESESRERRTFQSPRYQQNYQQPPIQIYLAPNQNSRPRDGHHHRRHSEDKEYRENRRWRERREELQQQPQTPYFENQFNRDDTHW